LAANDRLAIVIVTFNSMDEIDGCLQSLVGHTDPFPTTITVVDNASSDGTVAHIRERWPSVSVIESGANLGFAKANNLGIRSTQSEFVLLMNPDTVAPPAAIQTLVRSLASHPEAAIAGPFPGTIVGRASHALGRAEADGVLASVSPQGPAAGSTGRSRQPASARGGVGQRRVHGDPKD
jgi:GT2 family glycosyltransferase